VGADVAWAVVSIVGIAAVVVIKLAKMRFGPRGDRAVEDAVTRLESQISELRGQVADLEERLDFTERLLAQGHEGDKLPRP
jgi:hypothetical protein